MTTGPRWPAAALGLALVAVVIAAAGVLPGVLRPASARLTVLAAASLSDAFAALGDRFELNRPGLQVAVASDASSTLRIRIELGATADVFAAADIDNPAALTLAGLAGPPVTFASNRIVIVVPADNPAGIDEPADLGAAGVRIVAAGPAVPITRYADKVIDRLASLPATPADFAALVAANVVSREDNVRAVLAKVALGEADAGIVYATDARSASDVRVVAIPPTVDVRAVYAAVVPTTAADPASGRAFVEWLVGPEAQSVLAGFGFLPPPGA